MTMRIIRRIAPWAVLSACFAVVVTMAATAPYSQAQQAPVCHALMVLDRSGSVGQTNEVTLKNQILRLFQPPQYSAANPSGGLYDDNIFLAFWSFSYNAQAANLYSGLTNPNPGNYDWPDHDFVSSRGGSGIGPGSFTESLDAVVSNGSTDYEQGFGYNNGVQNQYIANIISQTDIIVFMTDGLPNTPGGSDNNPTARAAARSAVLKLRQANPGIIIIGGLVQNSSGTQSQSGLNYAINGGDTNATNTFQISSNYSDLARQLSAQIGTRCDALNPPPPPSDYNLEPSVSTNDRVISGSGSAAFQYNINNRSKTDTSDPSGWTIQRVIVARGQSVDSLETFKDANGNPYRDQYSCNDLLNLVNGNGTCSQIAQGQGSFAPGLNTLNVGSAGNIVLDDQWGVGTKLCYVLTIDKPTVNASPTNRYSDAACTIIGKRPFVQVWGGDLVAGKYFAGDDPSSILPADIRANIVTKTVGGQTNTYGSWAEYGAFATGDIVGFGTMRGLENGSTSPDQASWSDLTFSNTQNQFGRFTSNGGSLGTIPDVGQSLLTGRSVVRDLTGIDSIIYDASSVSGIYKKTTGNIRLDASTIEKGKNIILYVPNGNVTIAGNITYNPGPYTSIGQIPQLVIIAKNILIDDSVSNVDAWLVADGDTNNGTINTCDRPGTLTSEICNVPLKVNGPVLARTLILRRTGGAGTGGASGDPAEIFDLRADAYLWAYSEGRSEQRVETTFTTELPPFF